MGDKPVDIWQTAFGQGLDGLLKDPIWVSQRNAVRHVAGLSARFSMILLASATKFRLNKTARFLFQNPKDVLDIKSLVDDQGWIRTPAGQRTSLRAIRFFASPVEKLFEPHPVPNVLDDGDAITLRFWDLVDTPPRVRDFVAVAAHEMQHALNHYASAIGQQGATDFRTRIAAFFKDEAGARTSETIVRKEINDPSVKRTLQTARTIGEQIEIIQGGTNPSDIARSFPSTLYRRTYAEHFALTYLKKYVIKPPLQPVDWHLIWKDVDALLDRPEGSTSPIADPEAAQPTGAPAIEQIAEPLRSLPDYAQALALFAVFGGQIAGNRYMDFALVYLIERIFDFRWRKFERVHGNSPTYFEELEIMIKAHAGLLVPSIKDASFEVMYGDPIPHALKTKP